MISKKERTGIRIRHYGIDTEPLERIAGYHMSELCVKQLGTAACCAEILYELFSFGFTDEERRKTIAAFQKELKRAEEELAEGKRDSPEDICEEVYREWTHSCEDPDLKQYI